MLLISRSSLLKKHSNMSHYRFVFFGTPEIAVTALKGLSGEGLVPSLIVTAPDRPSGRGMKMTETPVKAYARTSDIPCISPEKITPDIIEHLTETGPWDFFIVVAYGKILRQPLLDIVNGKVINIHPSLLPLYRGPSPIESVLLSDDVETGVTVMQIDADVDHGPTIAMEKFPIEKGILAQELETKSALIGARLIALNIEAYAHDTKELTEQDHSIATFTKKIQKIDGLLDESLSDWEKWKHYRAYTPWPGISMVVTKRGLPVRIKITKAHYSDETFTIDECTPENRKPLSEAGFKQWLSS